MMLMPLPVRSRTTGLVGAGRHVIPAEIVSREVAHPGQCTVEFGQRRGPVQPGQRIGIDRGRGADIVRRIARPVGRGVGQAVRRPERDLAALGIKQHTVDETVVRHDAVGGCGRGGRLRSRYRRGRVIAEKEPRIRITNGGATNRKRLQVSGRSCDKHVRTGRKHYPDSCFRRIPSES